MRYSEETLKFWTAPLSKTEEERVDNTINMIKSAINGYDKLNFLNIEVFAQGSYANNTNVRQNSDVDICVMLTSTVFCNYVDGKRDADYGYTDGTISYREFKEYVIEALKIKFGNSAISVGNKCINIRANSYHVNADVIPSFQYRDFKIINSIDPKRYVEGIKYFATDGKEIINYPKNHIDNGKQKNIATNYKYKKLVRIMKHVRNDMVSDGKTDGEIISSFLVECLVWNVPNDQIMKYSTWENTLRNAIAFLWKAIDENKQGDWGEVSERLYLFHNGRKWTAGDAKKFLYDMYEYLGY